MLRVLNRDHKQHVLELMCEFLSCQFAFLTEKAFDDDGYLLAVSDDPDSYTELCDFADANRNRGIVALAGTYLGPFSI